MNLQTVQIQRLHTTAKLPERKTIDAAGYDVFACCADKDIVIQPSQVQLVPTGIAVAIPKNFHIEVRPRSGLSSRHKLLMPNAPGTVDADYRGEIFVPLLNLAERDFVVNHHMRIAQLLLRETWTISWQNVEELSVTERGSSGFGSTGTH
ncbi:MAG: dUTP diphosphatase [Spirochaetota bacterium]